MPRSISVRISGELHCALKAWAKRMNVPVAVLVRDLLWNKLESVPSQGRTTASQF